MGVIFCTLDRKGSEVLKFDGNLFSPQSVETGKFDIRVRFSIFLHPVKEGNLNGDVCF